MCQSLLLTYTDSVGGQPITVVVPRFGDGFDGTGIYILELYPGEDLVENRMFKIEIGYGLTNPPVYDPSWYVAFYALQDGSVGSMSWEALHDNSCPNISSFSYAGGDLVGLNFTALSLSEYIVAFPPHKNILASGVSNVEHIAQFDAMVEQRFANLDIEAVLIYLIDTVDVDALPSLAAQFDVLGYKGYGLAQTEQQKRDIIKRAIELHRYKGTPWSIKEALRAIGYYDATIQERLVNPIYYDGTYNHNGSQFYGPGHWADFRVKIDLGNDMGVTAQSASDAVKLILEYKNARSRLRDVSYMANLIEYVTGVTEELEVNIEVISTDAMGYYYDGTYLHNGEIVHGTIIETT